MSSYLMEGLRQLLFEPSNPFFAMEAEGVRAQASFACVTKSRHYGPVKIFPEADLFSDRFQVYGFQSRSAWGYLPAAWAIRTGRNARRHGLSGFSAQRVECAPLGGGEGDVFLEVDGELAGSLPCRIETVPDALTLLVPDPEKMRAGRRDTARTGRLD
jgi:diacylglycerol kinase family enzyme